MLPMENVVHGVGLSQTGQICGGVKSFGGFGFMVCMVGTKNPEGYDPAVIGAVLGVCGGGIVFRLSDPCESLVDGVPGFC